MVSLWEWIASILDRISIIAPGKYFGLGLSLLSVGIVWFLSEVPYANLVAAGTALISLGAFTQSLGAPKAVVIVISSWAVFYTAPAFLRAISGLSARDDVFGCVSTELSKHNPEVDSCADETKKWIKGD